jgi:hypothetical protein
MVAMEEAGGGCKENGQRERTDRAKVFEAHTFMLVSCVGLLVEDASEDGR